LFLNVPLAVQAQNWRIHLYSDSTISNVTLWKVDNDFLYVLDSVKIFKISVDSIAALDLIHDSNYDENSMVGLGGGMALGTFAVVILASVRTEHEETDNPLVEPLNILGGTICGGIAGFIVGNLISAIQDIDNKYDVSKYPHLGKVTFLNRLINETQKYK
jgi:hypothetical protein